MALVVYDRVQETTTTTGTGAVTLLGAVAGFQSFAVVGNGNTTFYCIADQGGGTNWEVGVGTYSTTGPTLTRTTVFASSNSGSLVNFTSGTKSVFVTYPAEKSVNLDASGNVTALGTVSSGTWQGTTVGVAYGGTGVTSSSGANSVVLRDANSNVIANNFLGGYNVITAAAGTTVLTVASAYYQRISGSTTQTIQLPNATTMANGQGFTFDNDSSGAVTIVDNASGFIDTVPSGGYSYIFVEDNSTSAGSWGKYALIPASYDFSTSTANFGGATITNATYNGNTIGTAYGGTNLTGFSAANNALYSTSSSALTAGTLPVLAGGTGVTSSTGSGSVVLNTSPTLVTPLLGTPTSGNLANCTGYPAGSISGTINLATQVTGTLPVANGGTGATTLTGYMYGNGTSAVTASTTIPGSAISGNISGNAANVTGTVAIANGGTGQTTASAAFNALSPITTTGDLIVGNGTNSATRLGIGTANQVLTSNGTTATWSSPSTGAGTITRTDFTATAGQTVFTVSYQVGLIDVYRNGVKLATTDFTATNGTSFTLAVGANSGDIVQAEVFSSLNIYATITTDTFSGNGSTTAFTMSVSPSSSGATLVVISGVTQDPSSYTVSGTTLTFSTAPPAGTNNISVRYLGVPSVTTVGSFSGGTTGLTPSSATSGTVTLGGVLNVANGGTGQSSFTSGGALYASGSTTIASGTLPVTAGGTGVTTSTGSGSVVLASSPTITTPTINQINTSVANTSLGAGNASIMKNRIINGAMVIDQRNAGASTTPASTSYTLDRWVVYTPGSKFSVQQNAGSVTPPVGFSKYLGITSTSAYSISSGDISAIAQLIEGYNVADLNWGSANAKTVTLSFWVYSSLTGTFGGALSNNGQTRSYPFSYTISSANTWQQISISIAGDTTGTWTTDNTAGIRLFFSIGTGSTYSGTAGAWAGAAYLSSTGATSVVGTSGATFYITGCQLEVGSSATGFEYRQYTTELQLCQRYYTYIGNETVGTEIPAGSNGTARVRGTYYYPVTMRAAPSASIAGTPGFYTYAGTTPTYSSPANIAGTTTKYATIDLNITGATLTAGQWANNISFNTTGCYIAWSAEL